MRYFFIGIGGVSMSALAKLLRDQGHQVVGSDAVASANTRELQTMGIKVYLGHAAANLQQQKIDRVVINGAIAEHNPELLWARKNGIKIMYRETVLALLAQKYQHVVAVAGCHGKSSTTAMIGKIFATAGVNPTVHVGAQNNLLLGGKQWLITEACEFRKSFLKLQPYLAVVTNVDADHLDCYQDLAEIKTCFAQFASQTEILIKNAEDPNSQCLQGRLRTITFGITQGDVHAKNIHETAAGICNFELVLNPQIWGQFYRLPPFKLTIPGKHNLLNALAAITAGLTCHLPLLSIREGIAQFQGIARRFQMVGYLQKTPIILDYAHHPQEIFSTLQTAKKLYRKFLIVFQPHTYTRTIALWERFVNVLQQVPDLVLYKTYAARGKVIVGGRALDLSRTLKVPYFASTDKLTAYLEQHVHDYDAVILCGAGDVVSGEFLIDKLQPA